MATRRLLDETRFPTRFVIDPANGDDEAVLVLELVTVNGVPNVEQVTATLATLQGAFDRVPQQVRHPIFIELPLDTIAAGPTGPATYGPEAHLTGRMMDLAESQDLDPPNLVFDATPGVYIMGQPTVTQATVAVTAATVSSVTAGSLTPAVDAHRGSVVEIMSGTGVGQKRRIIRNDGAGVFQLLSNWSTTPDVTSTMRITVPGSIINGAVILGGLNSQQSAFVAFDANCKLLADAASGSGNALIVRNAVAACGGEVEGLAEGSAGIAVFIEADATLFTDYINLRDDPTFANLFPCGMYFHNGAWRMTDRSSATGVVSGIVAQAATFDIRNNSVFEARVDADGNRPTLGGRSAGPGIDFDGSCSGDISRATGAGDSIQGYTVAGVRVTRLSSVDLSGLDISDNAQGVQVLGGSLVNLNSVTSDVDNDGYGAEIRGDSVALVARVLTTLTGATTDVQMGNKTSGVDHVWTDVPAGDALKCGGGSVDLGAGIIAGQAEFGIAIDRAAP